MFELQLKLLGLDFTDDNVEKSTNVLSRAAYVNTV